MVISVNARECPLIARNGRDFATCRRWIVVISLSLLAQIMLPKKLAKWTHLQSGGDDSPLMLIQW